MGIVCTSCSNGRLYRMVEQWKVFMFLPRYFHFYNILSLSFCVMLRSLCVPQMQTNDEYTVNELPCAFLCTIYSIFRRCTFIISLSITLCIIIFLLWLLFLVLVQIEKKLYAAFMLTRRVHKVRDSQKIHTYIHCVSRIFFANGVSKGILLWFICIYYTQINNDMTILQPLFRSISWCDTLLKVFGIAAV